MVLRKITQSEVEAPGNDNSSTTINVSIAVVISAERQSKPQWHEYNTHYRAFLNFSCHFRAFFPSALAGVELAVAFPPLSSNMILPFIGSENLPCSR